MKLKTIAVATAFALSSTFALAQTGGGPLPENSGTTLNGGAVGNGSMGTTGMGTRNPSVNASPSGTTGNPIGGAGAANPLGGAAGAGTIGSTPGRPRR
jgi:hypothetical protein